MDLWLFHDKTLKQTLNLTCELGTVEHNSLTPKFRNCEAFESYEHESPETQQCVIEEETDALGIKPLRRPLSGQQSIKESSWDT